MVAAAFTIRRFHHDDTTALAALWLDAVRPVHGFFDEAELLRQQALVAETYLPGSETWVADAAGAPLGFIGLLDDFIGGLFVAPGAQGQGVGRALVAHALELRGRLELEVYAAKSGAHAFYARLGFPETARRDHDDLGNPFALIRMARHT